MRRILLATVLVAACAAPAQAETRRLACWKMGPLEYLEAVYHKSGWAQAAVAGVYYLTTKECWMEHKAPPKERVQLVKSGTVKDPQTGKLVVAEILYLRSIHPADPPYYLAQER